MASKNEDLGKEFRSAIKREADVQKFAEKRCYFGHRT